MAPTVLKCGVNIFEGFLNIRESSDYFVVNVPNYPCFDHYTISCDLQLKIILDEIYPELNELAKNCMSIDSFVSAFAKITSKFLNKQANISAPVRCHSFYEAVHRELCTIGSHAQVSADFSVVTLVASDDESRPHKAVVRLHDSYPHEALVIEHHDFPVRTLSPAGVKNSFSLTEFYKRFLYLIKAFQPFWKMMDILDANCWVLEPQKPCSSDNYRRIQISEYCSALLTFDPYNAHVRPTIEFRGKQVYVEKYRNLLEAKLMDNYWEEDVDIHLNLLSILELDSLPTNDLDTEKITDLVQPGDCAICFEERLDGQPANQRCDNSLCDSQYHQICLLKYLSCTLKNMKMKNAILGRCPTCRDSIGCPALTWDFL